MDNRRFSLLTALPPLPALGEPLPITLAEALGRLRQQGGRDLESLADALAAEGLLREALEEWVLGPSGSRIVPVALPPTLRALFDEELVAGMPEDAWIDAVWQEWFDLMAAVGRSIGAPLLSRWSAWESAVRARVAVSRRPDRGEGAQSSPPGADDPALDSLLAAWDTVRERGREGREIAAAMEAEQILDEGRLAFLDDAALRYSFTMDELAAYFLKLRLLERRRRWDPARGREFLAQAAAL